jgi:para-aminobenzoate synthetase component 1
MIRQRNEAIAYLNQLGKNRTPCLFFTDFEASQAFVAPLPLDGEDVLFNIGDHRNYAHIEPRHISISPAFMAFHEFNKAFSGVQQQINIGNSFLTNLTFSTPISSSSSLLDIFHGTNATFKICYEDHFVCFSPERFVSIDKTGSIASFPMKGTIDASVPDAEQKILNDPKEIAEHVTIVDLIRNDLSRIADQVHVPRFRYIDQIKSREKTLLQVSSEVRGQLANHWHESLGSLLFELLPAGSISGAPKPKTIEIIHEHEIHNRNFYTGICGVFDGYQLTSGVMIRFIEQSDQGLIYKSGAGITAQSIAEKEYQEIRDKIYVPIS